mmetsp:Transcript_14250/g.40674  ORF Transcript_14250/g.40674 Transcript_14250/m.40674 type:complete len:203 (-) Transcript_14250:1936-2544(-)
MFAAIDALVRDVPKLFRLPNVENDGQGGHHHPGVPSETALSMGRRGRRRRPGDDDALVKVLPPARSFAAPLPLVLPAVGAPLALQPQHGVLHGSHLITNSVEGCVEVGLHGVPEVLEYGKIVSVLRRIRPRRGARPQDAAIRWKRIECPARLHHVWARANRRGNEGTTCYTHTHTKRQLTKIKCQTNRLKVWPTDELNRARP